MKQAIALLFGLLFIASGCASQKARQQEVYLNLIDDLVWMQVGAGDDATEFEKQYPAERRTTDDLYIHFFYAESAYDYLVVSAFDGELVSAMAVKDFPGHFAFFDEDPNTIEERYRRMQRDLQLMELILSAFGSFDEYSDELNDE